MELRPYQQEAKDAIFEQWDSGVKKTLLVLPTGCGKTIVFAKVTEDCVRKGDRDLILAHREELLKQAANKIHKSTGLGCAVEKAEQSCRGSWFRIVVGSVQTLMSAKRLRKTTVTTFLISALFPLVPGAGMYYTMLEIVNNELDVALETGVTTLSTAALMALGILFVTTLSRVMFHSQQKKNI